MQTIKIEIPKGYEFDRFDKVSGEIKFKERSKEITERIKSVEDLLAYQSLTKQEFDEQCEGLTEDEVAYRLLKMLTESLNEGWYPDWNDHSQAKYYAWFEMGGSLGFQFYGYVLWHSASDGGSRLCFKTSKLAEHAGKHFADVYKKFMVID